MNDFKIKILEYDNVEDANEELEIFIKYCNNNYIEILDMKDHVIVNGDDYYSYTFIFKLKRDE